MLNLKSAYLYFLANKINFTKFIKKIYFTTSHYSRSLKTKIPEQLYYYPNSFLLSSFTEYKYFSLKLSDINAKKFWKEYETNKDEQNLNNFIWLNLIDRKNDSIVIQKIIKNWIEKNGSYKEKSWESSILSKRIISWILNLDIILNNIDNNFKTSFYKSIIIQTNHLKRNISYEHNPVKKIEIMCAIILTGLVFKDYYENYNQGTKDLERICSIFYDQDGFPVNRNPGDLVELSKYFILIKECIKDAQEYIPDFLETIIDKNLNNLKSLITQKIQIPLFNGAVENKIDNYLDYLEGLSYKPKKLTNKIGNIQILKNKKSIVFFDVGQPPKKKFSSNYQSGPLSFEYFFEDKKIITNCGFGFRISKKAMLLSRLTSAQSTLSINDNSVVKFERNKILNKAFGNSIQNGFRTFDYSFSEDSNEIKACSSHNAYEESLGCIHKREIKIEKKNDTFKGCDELIKNMDNKIINFNIRFHLYPGIIAVKTMGGKSILIQIEKNKSIIFTSFGEKISLEKSIFLGGNKILNNQCITISGNLINKSKKIEWEFRKKF